MDIEVIENSATKRRLRGRCNAALFTQVEALQNAGGFKRYEIDIYNTRGGRKPAQNFLTFIHTLIA